MSEATRREILGWMAAGALGAAMPRGATAAQPFLQTAARGRDARETAGKMPALRKRKIPSSGEEIPVVGLGTYQVFDIAESGAEFEEVKQILRLFHDEGGRVVDSSPMYGEAEGVLGKASREAGVNDALFMATKVWTRGKQSGIEQMQNSLRLLQRQRIELMQVHNLLDLDTHWATLQDWKKQKRFKYIGVTHYTEGAYDELERVIKRGGLDFVQLNYSILERDAERRLLPAAQENGVAVIVNRPFAAGGLFSRVRGRELPAFAKEIGCESWAQYFLKFILGHPAVTVAIPATRNPKHLRDNMGAGCGPLPNEKMRHEMVAVVRG